MATAEPLAKALYVILFDLKLLNEDCNRQVYIFRTNAELTWLYNQMSVVQLDIRLCNRVPRCITYAATQLCNWTV